MPYFSNILWALLQIPPSDSLHSTFLGDIHAFLYFQFQKETKIWEPCAFAPITFTSLSECPKLPISLVSLCSTLLQEWLPPSPAHTPHIPATYTPLNFPTSQAGQDSTSLLAPLLASPRCHHRRKRTSFQVWFANSCLHCIWSHIDFLGNHPCFPTDSTSFRVDSSSLVLSHKANK